MQLTNQIYYFARFPERHICCMYRQSKLFSIY